MTETSGQAKAAFNDRNLSLEALAESEQRFRTLVEALPDAILVHSENKIVFINPFCLRLLNAELPEQLLGKDIGEIVHPDYLPAIKSRIEECYSTGIASLPTESVLIACDGSPVEIEAVAIPICWNGTPAIEVVARDIRRRKRAEQEVRDGQKRLELAQKAGLRIGLWDWDTVTNTLIWSDETYRQFGYAHDVFSGRVEDALSRIHPEDRPEVEEAIGKVIAGGSEYAQQYRLVRPDGTICWIDARGVIVRDGSTHMLGIGVDITSLKKTEQSLLESEEKYLFLLNSAAEAIYGLDLKGNCTFCNRSCLSLLGYGIPKDLLGRNMHVLIHHTRADGTPYPETECEIYVAIRDGRASHIVEEVLWRADGTSFSAECWSYPMYKGGEVVGAVVTFVDISDRERAEQELRQSEEKYRELFEHATHGIFRSSMDGTLLDVNPALVAMLGYNSKEELLARNLDRDIYDNPDDRRAILERVGRKGRVDGEEVNWRRKDGKIIGIRLGGAAVHGQNGLFSHFEIIVEDVTERRSLEGQFRQAQKMEAIGLLAGGISHDFNNLLSVILGNSELLLETPQTEAQQQYGQQIIKATQRAAQLTRQLLAFSRKQILYPAILDLNTVVHDVDQILQLLIGEAVLIVKDLDTGLGSIRADRGQLEQVFMNLATNARDAMPNGGEFTIRTVNDELGLDDMALYPYAKLGRYVRLSVSDTGEGMTDAVRSRVFEPFFTTKAEGKGTGLGLATIYGIVKQSAGYVWVSSAPGRGTTFDIYLPRVNEKAPPLITSLEVRSKSPRGTETILVLEDEEPLRRVTCEFFTAMGYNVLQAGRGNHAIAVSEQYKGSISLIVSDVVLPDMSGPSIVAKVQGFHPEAKVLYVSGYAEIPVAQQLIAEGAILLQKPLSRGELLGKVDEMLHPPIASTDGRR
jgi:PAS domain S-box-containing protein